MKEKIKESIKNALLNYYDLDEAKIKEIVKDVIDDLNILEVGETFILTKQKPKCTVGDKYVVYRKDSELDYTTQYWFYNDDGKASVMYDGEYELIKR
jgi:hypothetical protein